MRATKHNGILCAAGDVSIADLTIQNKRVPLHSDGSQRGAPIGARLFPAHDDGDGGKDLAMAANDFKAARLGDVAGQFGQWWHNLMGALEMGNN